MSTPDSTPHEYLDTEIKIEGLESATDEQNLLAAFNNQPGIKSARLSNKTLAIEYEPVLIHRTQIVKLITETGLRVGNIETAQASPVIDAIHDDHP